MRQIVAEQWPALQREVRDANDGHGLPKFIAKAVEGYLGCGLLSRGFSRLYCSSCKTDQLVAFSCKKRGICPSCDGKRMTELGAHIVDGVIGNVPVRQFVVTVPPYLRAILAWNADLRGKVLSAIMRAIRKHYVTQAEAAGATEPQFGAISVLQRWSGSLRIFPHFHILVADGVWVHSKLPGAMEFLGAPALTEVDLEELLADVYVRATRQAERHFAKRRAAAADGDDDELAPRDPALAAVLRQSLFGKDELEQLAVPPAKGLPSATAQHVARLCVDGGGFNIHAATRVHECARERLEHLVRYVCRPVIAVKRLEAVGPHHVRIWLKNEWKGGKNAVLLTRRELTVRIVAQIPLPRVAGVRYHGIWAPAANDRDLVVPALSARCAHNKRKGKTPAANDDGGDDGPAGGESDPRQPDHGTSETDDGGKAALAAKDTRLRWAEALKRAFGFEIMECPCGGRRQLLAAVQSSVQIEKILRHVGLWQQQHDVIAIRGPPGEDLYPADELPGPEFDAVDEMPADEDLAA